MGGPGLRSRELESSADKSTQLTTVAGCCNLRLSIPHFRSSGYQSVPSAVCHRLLSVSSLYRRHPCIALWAALPFCLPPHPFLPVLLLPLLLVLLSFVAWMQFPSPGGFMGGAPPGAFFPSGPMGGFPQQGGGMSGGMMSPMGGGMQQGMGGMPGMGGMGGMGGNMGGLPPLGGPGMPPLTPQGGPSQTMRHSHAHTYIHTSTHCTAAAAALSLVHITPRLMCTTVSLSVALCVVSSTCGTSSGSIGPVVDEAG